MEFYKNFNDKQLQEEIDIILAEGGLTFDQVDYLLYLETLLSNGELTDEQKRDIVHRNI